MIDQEETVPTWLKQNNIFYSFIEPRVKEFCRGFDAEALAIAIKNDVDISDSLLAMVPIQLRQKPFNKLASLYLEKNDCKDIILEVINRSDPKSGILIQDNMWWFEKQFRKVITKFLEGV